MNSCWPLPCCSGIELTPVNSISRKLFSRLRNARVGVFSILHTIVAQSITVDVCHPYCLFCVFSLLCTYILLRWKEKERDLHTRHGCIPTHINCHKGSSSFVLCNFLTNPNIGNAFFHQRLIKWRNSGSSMVDIFPKCLTKVGHWSTVIIISYTNAESFRNLGPSVMIYR